MAARYVCIVVIEGEEASREEGDDCEAGTRTTLEAASISADKKQADAHLIFLRDFFSSMPITQSTNHQTHQNFSHSVL